MHALVNFSRTFVTNTSKYDLKKPVQIFVMLIGLNIWGGYTRRGAYIKKRGQWHRDFMIYQDFQQVS